EPLRVAGPGAAVGEQFLDYAVAPEPHLVLVEGGGADGKPGPEVLADLQVVGVVGVDVRDAEVVRPVVQRRARVGDERVNAELVPGATLDKRHRFRHSLVGFAGKANDQKDPRLQAGLVGVDQPAADLVQRLVLVHGRYGQDLRTAALDPEADVYAAAVTQQS